MKSVYAEKWFQCDSINGLKKQQLCVKVPEKLEDFLTAMDSFYKAALINIDMFNVSKTAFWDEKQRQTFVNLFYHARGHFYKFLWCIGSRSSELTTKNKVLENMREEFGEEKKSHEQLYFDFAQAVGVSLEKEIYEEKFYLPFLREFDQNHIKWIMKNNSEPNRLGLFAAYERLDNIDYANLLNLVKSIGITHPDSLSFFTAHSNASHFERLVSELNKFWRTNREELVSAFEFIYINQLNMWSSLSEKITQVGDSRDNELKKNYEELNNFLKEWDTNYKSQAEKINLFNKTLTSEWRNSQRKYFIKIFYHSRGHFSDFLFHLGNYAPNKVFKEMILENIKEEFSGDHLSHEQLYLDFALKEGVDLSNEHFENKYYIEKMKQFNSIHMEWLYKHKNWDSKLSAFSAYERLDSTDYELLSNVLFNRLEDEHVFFKIHREADHFDKTYSGLITAWQENRHLVEEAFSFVEKIQLDMWRDLSDEIFLFP
jgi:hypothetical protein